MEHDDVAALQRHSSAWRLLRADSAPLIVSFLDEAFVSGGARGIAAGELAVLAHRTQWVREAQPTRATLSRLTDAEAQLYAELLDDVQGPAVRLEQERIRMSAVPDDLGR